MDNNGNSHYDTGNEVFSPISHDQKKIRVGIMLDDIRTEFWIYKILEDIVSSEYASLALVVLNENHENTTSNVKKSRQNRKKMLYHSYTGFENRIIHPEPDAFAPVDIQKLLENVPVIKIQPRMEKNFDWIEEEGIERIKKFSPDAILRFGPRHLKGDILQAARYGIWSYYHGDNTVIRGGPPGFWETFERMGERGVILQQVTEDPYNGVVLYRSSFPLHSLFTSENNNNCYLRSSLFVPRTLKKLYNEGGDTFFADRKRENNELFFYNHRDYSAPANFTFLTMFLKYGYHLCTESLSRHFFQSQWVLMFDLQDQISTSFWRFKKMIPPKDRFWADPHVFFKNDTYYIFIEEFIFKTRKGHISLIEMQQSGEYSEPVKVLEEPFHLSYPHVFDYNGTVYMIPETRRAKSINLYQCTDFPTAWKHKVTLMDSVEAVDATILFHKNTWWLFTNIAEPAGTSPDNELFLFYSDDLISQNWTSHPLNPVISDSKRARPAGKIFERNGKLYRPSQCMNPSYGYGIKLNEIDVLTGAEYQEREIAYIEPKWDRKLKGVHTFCHENRLTMIDGAYKKFVL